VSLRSLNDGSMQFQVDGHGPRFELELERDMTWVNRKKELVLTPSTLYSGQVGCLPPKKERKNARGLHDSGSPTCTDKIMSAGPNSWKLFN